MNTLCLINAFTFSSVKYLVQKNSAFNKVFFHMVSLLSLINLII